MMVNPKPGEKYTCDPYGGENQFEIVVLGFSGGYIETIAKSGGLDFTPFQWGKYLTQKKIYKSESREVNDE